MPTLLIKRGNESNIPNSLLPGEMVYALDKRRLYIGSGSNSSGHEIEFNRLTSSGLFVSNPNGITRINLQSNGSVVSGNASITTRVAGGTSDQPEATQNGHYTSIQMQSFGGSTWSTTGRILFQSSGDHTESSRPTNIVLSTVPPGTSTLVDRLKVNGTGVQVTGSMGVTENIVVNGNLTASYAKVTDLTFGDGTKLSSTAELLTGSISQIADQVIGSIHSVAYNFEGDIETSGSNTGFTFATASDSNQGNPSKLRGMGSYLNWRIPTDGIHFYDNSDSSEVGKILNDGSSWFVNVAAGNVTGSSIYGGEFLTPNQNGGYSFMSSANGNGARIFHSASDFLGFRIGYNGLQFWNNWENAVLGVIFDTGNGGQLEMPYIRSTAGLIVANEGDGITFYDTPTGNPSKIWQGADWVNLRMPYEGFRIWNNSQGTPLFEYIDMGSGGRLTTTEYYGYRSKLNNLDLTENQSGRITFATGSTGEPAQIYQSWDDALVLRIPSGGLKVFNMLDQTDIIQMWDNDYATVATTQFLARGKVKLDGSDRPVEFGTASIGEPAKMWQGGDDMLIIKGGANGVRFVNNADTNSTIFINVEDGIISTNNFNGIFNGNVNGNVYGTASYADSISFVGTSIVSSSAQFDSSSNVSFGMITGSLIYVSGSLKAGRSSTTQHSITGTLILTGSMKLTGSLSVAGTISDSNGNIHYYARNGKTAQYTLVASDVDKYINTTAGGIIIPASIMPTGSVVMMYNNSTSSQTITSGSTSVTIRLAGTTTTGARTVASYGLANIMCVDPNVFVVFGAGVT